MAVVDDRLLAGCSDGQQLHTFADFAGWCYLDVSVGVFESALEFWL